MISILKTLFDLSFYYMLTGFYMSIFLPGELISEPLGFGLLILITSVLLYGLIGKSRKKSSETSPLIIICLALPALIFLLGPSMIQFIHFLPAWLFVCYSLLTGKTSTNSVEFNARFKLSLKLLWLCVPGLMFVTRLAESIPIALPYLMLYLVSAVCLKRILRKEGSLKRSRDAVPIVIVIALSALLAVSQIRQFLADILGFILENILRVIVAVFVFATGWLADIIIGFFERRLNLDRQTLAAQGGEGFIDVAEYDPAMWVQIVFGVFIFAMLLLGVWFLVKLLFASFWGERLKKSKDITYIEQSEWLDESYEGQRTKVLKPRDHRQAVRWYYRKYLKAGASSGAEIEDFDTSLSVMQKLEVVFPKREQQSFRELYLKVRYSERENVNKEDAETASKLWKQMKKGV